MLPGLKSGTQSEPTEQQTGGSGGPSMSEIDKIANEHFDTLVGCSAASVNPVRIQAELDGLRLRTKKLEDFASNRVAHLLEKPTAIPTMPELDVCVDELEKLVLRYRMLFRASAPHTMLPTWQYDWQAIFREKWIPLLG
jgi:hypothetical protein